MMTREILIGKLALGGKNPVRIQSMTNTNTMDTMATVKQVLQLVAAGCEMVRITARNKAEAENLCQIKEELYRQGCQVPLIADIHFQPEAAEVAARIVEKVRINPGNYVDKSKAGQGKTEYTENEYRGELEKIRLRLLPLIRICKEHGTAIRVGVNHGSLSERITAKYGDTPDGMVASALEYIDMFATEGFHNLVLSMKSSNVKTMIYSYRLLAARMLEKGYNYPLHLGVTEAGAGMDARVKSAAGIGELLMEGLGDTIRVSLTEDPVKEIPVAQMLCDEFAKYRKLPGDNFHHAYSFNKAETYSVGNIGGNYPPVIVSSCKPKDDKARFSPDYYLDPEKEYFVKTDNAEKIPLVNQYHRTFIFNKPYDKGNQVMLLDYDFEKDTHLARNILFSIKEEGVKQPVVLYKKYDEADEEKLIVMASAELAFFLTDGLLNGICLDAPLHQDKLPEIMFSILQALGLRRVKADFIACPTCGRTSYNVEGTLKNISDKLSHLKHLKIAVMGC
ncbi:MAG: (E)-4-hydroxy-3-methylbut-2-enyl-diphosphate synthase, partial [Bacteroidota bacterium]